MTLDTKTQQLWIDIFRDEMAEISKGTFYVRSTIVTP